MGKGGGGGPSMAEAMEMQRTLMREQMALSEKAAVEQEERMAQRRAEEEAAELERRRLAEVEKADKMAEEEMREGLLMAEADAGEADSDTFGELNLDSPQIESPDYAPQEELE